MDVVERQLRVARDTSQVPDDSSASRDAREAIRGVFPWRIDAKWHRGGSLYG